MGDVFLFGVQLIGINVQSLQKVILTLSLLLVLIGLRRLVEGVLRRIWRHRDTERARFWTRQGLSLLTTLLFVLGVVSIWFTDPTRLATVLGLISAGLVFALQQVVTAMAGYGVILRGKTFTVGDRITLGGVRGDVVALSFLQTTLLEMGQPPAVQGADPAMWVRSRQHTGRLVTVSNAKVFSDPVYNYTRDFPFLWEELAIPIPFAADRARAEALLLACATRHTAVFQAEGAAALRNFQRQYRVAVEDALPHVYYRITDNWLELSVRFLVPAHGVRVVKDAISRDLLRELDTAGIGIASATYAIVALPPVVISGIPARSTADRAADEASRQASE